MGSQGAGQKKRLYWPHPTAPPITPLLLYPKLSYSYWGKKNKAGGWFTTPGVLIIFICCDNIPVKNNLRKEMCTLVTVWGYSPSPKAKQLEYETAGHMASAARKQRKLSIGAQPAFSSSLSLRSMPIEWYCSQSVWVSPPSESNLATSS